MLYLFTYMCDDSQRTSRIITKYGFSLCLKRFLSRRGCQFFTFK